MELIQQLEKWKAQVALAKKDSSADMDVAKRLLNHGIEALGEIEKLRGEVKVLRGSHDWLSREKERLESAIRRTLDENGHLADGDNCTLIHLVRAMPTPCDADDLPSNVEHNQRTAASSPGVRVDGPVGPHVEE